MYIGYALKLLYSDTGLEPLTRFGLAGRIGCKDSVSAESSRSKGIIKLGTDVRGNYRRDVGWEPKPSGGFRQHTFSFGTNQTTAQQRCLRVLRCWDAVDARANRAGKRPLWTPLTLSIAKAEAAGNEDYDLEPDAFAKEEGFSQPHESIDPERFHKLQQDFNMIRLRLVEEQAGQVNRQREAIKATATGKLACLSGPVVVWEGQTLYEALDAFAAWHRDNYKTPDGRPTYHAYIAGERIKAIKRLAPDLSLQAFGLDEIERLIATWKNRPMSSRGKPYSISACKNHLKVIRGFIKWLHRSDSTFAPSSSPCPANNQLSCSARRPSNRISTH